MGSLCLLPRKRQIRSLQKQHSNLPCKNKAPTQLQRSSPRTRKNRDSRDDEPTHARHASHRIRQHRRRKNLATLHQRNDRPKRKLPNRAKPHSLRKTSTKASHAGNRAAPLRRSTAASNVQTREPHRATAQAAAGDCASSSSQPNQSNTAAKTGKPAT